MIAPFQPGSGNSVPAPLKTEPVHVPESFPARRRSRHFSGALIASLLIHGVALAAVVANPGRFFAFTGEDGGSPGALLLVVAVAAEPPREGHPEVESKVGKPVRFVEKIPVHKRPAIPGELSPIAVQEPDDQAFDFTETPPLAFVTLEALAELPPGYEPPAEPEPPAARPPPSKASSSKSNTAKVPKPGAAGPVTKARVKRQMGIRYPEGARREGVEGFCIVDISISAGGRVTGARISKSSGDARLDREALRAARSSTFHAARKGDAAIASRARMPFRFVLR